MSPTTPTPETVDIHELGDVARQERAKAAPVPEQPTLDAPNVIDVEVVTADEIIPPDGQTSGGVPALIDDGGSELALVREDEWSTVPASLVEESASTSIPRLSVNRKESGGFVIEGRGDVVREIEFVLMDRVHTRAWWPLPFGKGEAAPACRSNDNVRPTPESPAQQDGWEPPKGMVGDVPAKTCAECPNSRWHGDEPPPCALAFEAMIGVPNFDHGSVDLYRTRFSGMGLAPADNYWATFEARLPKRPPIAYVSKVTLEPEQTPNGVFLRPRFERVKELTVSQARPLIEERERRMGEWQEIVAAEIPVDDDLSATAARNVDRQTGEVYNEEPF